MIVVTLRSRLSSPPTSDGLLIRRFAIRFFRSAVQTTAMQRLLSVTAVPSTHALSQTAVTGTPFLVTILGHFKAGYSARTSDAVESITGRAPHVRAVRARHQAGVGARSRAAAKTTARSRGRWLRANGDRRSSIDSDLMAARSRPHTFCSTRIRLRHVNAPKRRLNARCLSASMSATPRTPLPRCDYLVRCLHSMSRQP
jgi:hypothetical protein